MCYKYPGPRCSNHATKELKKALVKYHQVLRTNDAEACFFARQEVVNAEDNYYMTPKGQEELKRQIEETGDPTGELGVKLEFGQESRKSAIKAAKAIDVGDVNTEHVPSATEELPSRPPVQYNPLEVESPEYKALEAELKERTEAPEFVALIAERDRTRNERQALRAEIEEQKKLIEGYENNAEGKIAYPGAKKPTEEEKLRAQDSIDEAYDKLTQLNSDHLDAYYAYHLANHELEQYKNQTALIVADMNTVAGDPGVAYTGKTLGDCVEIASYDSGTREWLEERQNGIGGSDVGAILKLNEEHGQANFNDFVKSKTEAYSQAEVDAQAEANSGFAGPTGRGNAWETAIVREYMANNPDQTVMYSKASWRHKENAHHKANVDGLLSSDGVTPDGILEIKTASDMSKWEKIRADGSIEERVPLEYRAQVLWYLRQTGFEYADIAVKVDDREYRSRRIYADEDINPYDKDAEGYSAVSSLANNMPRIEQVWKDEVVARREGKRPVRSLKSEFDKAADSKNIHGQAVQLAAWRQIPVSEATEIIRATRKETRGVGAKKTMSEAMREEYAKGGPTTWTKDLVSVDIETSGMGPNSGEIIEIGIRRTRPNGEIVEEYSERFGLRNEKVLDVVGTGAQEVHKIAPDDIRGKRNFSHPEVQAKVKSFLMDENAITVAHNKPFEERWFDQYVPGFRKQRARLTSSRFKAERAGKKHPEPKAIMDTMFHSRYLTPETENNKLATFTVHNGIPYEDAHSALPDAQMTQKAVYNHDRRLRGLPIIDERKPTK